MCTNFRYAGLHIFTIVAFSLLFTLTARGQSDTVAYFTFTGNLDGWSVTDLSAQATGDNWVWSQTGPSGTFPIAPISSSTADGGYLLFDSDLLCGGSQNARIQSPVLDFSQESVVELRWQQLYRRFESAFYVEVSKNGGQTFAPFELSPALMNDEYSGVQGENPDYVTLDLSPVAAGEANVVIAFRFFSEETIFGDDAGCGYAWMVDDVALANAILPPAENDLAIVAGSHSGAANRVTPRSQLEPLNLGARVVNNGLNSATGKLYVRLFDNAGTAPILVYTDSVDVPLLSQNEESPFLLMPGSFTPPEDQKAYIGRYELVLDGVTDEATADNMARFDFSISESAFAKTTGPAIYARPQSSESWGFGNVFSLKGVNNELSRTLFWLRPIGDFSTSTLDSIFVEVYGVLGDGDNDGEYAAGSEAVLLNRQGYSLEGLLEPTRFFVTPLPDTSLSISPSVEQIGVFIRYEDGLAGDSRWVEIGGGQDNVNTNYDAEKTAAALNGINRSYAIRSIGDGPLLASLFPGFIPDVRAYVNENRSVNAKTPLHIENALQVWPNPASSLLHWSVKDPSFVPANLTIEVIDGLGKTVLSASNTTSTAIDVSSLPAGIYHLSVKKMDGKQVVDRFIKR